MRIKVKDIKDPELQKTILVFKQIREFNDDTVVSIKRVKGLRVEEFKFE